jgi:hypothetical protein
MPLRVPASGDPTAPASASFLSLFSSPALPSVASSSASAANCSMASQVRRPPPDAPPQFPSSSTGKRARLNGPDLTARADLTDESDVDMCPESAEERKAEVNAPRLSIGSAVGNPLPTAAVAASSSSSSSSPSSLVTSSTSSLPTSSLGMNVPVWASLKKLRAAGIDPRVLTSLVVDFDVDTRAGPAPLVLKRVYSSEPASKLAAVASLLGDPKAGFGIIPPTLPRALLSADAATRANWSAPQQAWFQELVSQARDSGELIREPGSKPEQRGVALTALFKLIAADSVKPLWPQQEFTSKWADLLLLPSAILHDTARDVTQTVGADKAKLVVPEHTYRVRLCCSSAEVAYVVACCVSNYALLPREAPEASKRLRAILAANSVGLQATSANADTSVSEADSSDSDGEWHTYHSSRTSAARQRKRAASRVKQLAAFTAKELSAERFKTDSANPLLQLATRVTMRSWQHRFVECFVSNWQSVGCRDRFNQDDPAFQRVTTAVPELQDATAVRWQLHEQVGGTLVSLFIRDDLCVQLPKLNTVLRQLPELQQAALKVVCEAHPRRARGWSYVSNDRRRYCLTPEDVPSIRRSAVPGTALSTRPQSTSTMPSWAAVLSAARPVPLPAVRRPASTTSIDHRPRKEQHREPPVTSPPASGPLPAPKIAKHVTVAPNPSPAPWEARIAAIESRLNGIQALCDALRDVPRLLANIQHKLDLQASSTMEKAVQSPPSSSSSGTLHRSTASAVPAVPSPVPCDTLLPTAAVAELSRRVDAQECVLDRICGQLDYLTPALMALARSQTGGVLFSPVVPSAVAPQSVDFSASPIAIRQIE